MMIALDMMSSRLRTTTDLVRLLRNRRVVFLGDSVSEHYFAALECAARAQLPLVSVSSERVASPGLWRACVDLLEYVPPAACKHPALARHPTRNVTVKCPRWPGGETRRLKTGRCQYLGGTLERIRLSNGSWHPRGFKLADYNVSFFLVHVTTTSQTCYSCVASREHDATSCALVDLCKMASLPSAVEMVRDDLRADVVVSNTGLHYEPRTSAMYHADLQALLSELAAFAAGSARRAAVFRESSVQHFPVPSGGSHDPTQCPTARAD
jgi:hypothetical protein